MRKLQIKEIEFGDQFIDTIDSHELMSIMRKVSTEFDNKIENIRSLLENPVPLIQQCKFRGYLRNIIDVLVINSWQELSYQNINEIILHDDFFNKMIEVDNDKIKLLYHRLLRSQERYDIVFLELKTLLLKTLGENNCPIDHDDFDIAKGWEKGSFSERGFA